MNDNDNVDLGFRIEVVEGDALAIAADVLAVKSAPRSGGLDAVVRRKLQEAGHIDSSAPLPVGHCAIWPGENVALTREILVVGTPSVFDLGYAQLRDLGERFLEALWEAGSNARHMVTTVHGVRTALALDQEEAFRSLLLGMSDAYAAGHYPPTLQRITFIEQNAKRAALLRDALRQFLPAGPSLIDDGQLSGAGRDLLDETAEALSVVMAGPESCVAEIRKPEADETTPHIFVAMPFKDDFDDQFYLAIQPCVKELGLLCERMDLDTFTGDIVDHMLERIQTARLVIALLDDGNPNVFLEVGYAWGVGTRTVLMAHKEQPLPFDVRGHRVLIYDKIYQLKKMLQEELQRLLK